MSKRNEIVMRNAEPLTVLQLIGELQELVNRKPETAGWPVHILDLDEGDDVPEAEEDGKECLVTTVQTDKFSEKQGWVVSLCAEREARVWDAAPSESKSDGLIEGVSA